VENYLLNERKPIIGDTPISLLNHDYGRKGNQKFGRSKRIDGDRHWQLPILLAICLKGHDKQRLHPED